MSSKSCHSFFFFFGGGGSFCDITNSSFSFDSNLQNRTVWGWCHYAAKCTSGKWSYQKLDRIINFKKFMYIKAWNFSFFFFFFLIQVNMFALHKGWICCEGCEFQTEQNEKSSTTWVAFSRFYQSTDWHGFVFCS